MRSVSKTVKQKLNESYQDEITNHQFDDDWWGDNYMSFETDINSSVYAGVFNEKFFNKYNIKKLKKVIHVDLYIQKIMN